MITVYWYKDVDGVRTYKAGDSASCRYGEAHTAAEWIASEGENVFFCSTYYTDNAPTCKDCGISSCFVYEVWGPVGKSSPNEYVVTKCNSCNSLSSFKVDGFGINTTAVDMRQAHERASDEEAIVDERLRSWGIRRAVACPVA